LDEETNSQGELMSNLLFSKPGRARIPPSWLLSRTRPHRKLRPLGYRLARRRFTPQRIHL